MPSRSPLLSSVAVFLSCFLLIAGWQAVYCRLAAHGEPSALFVIGDGRRYPEALRQKAFVYRDSLGYDGMLYRAVAHDPLLSRGYSDTVDDPRYRWRRIFLPGLAALAAGGDPARVDLAYILVADVLLALGGVCFALLLAPRLAAPAAAGLYCLVPAVIATTDRMVVDGVAFTGFLALLLFYRRHSPAGLVGVLTALPLVRETGLALTAGALLDHLRQRRFKCAAALAASTLPLAGWHWFVALRTPPSGAAEGLLTPPLWPYLKRLATPFDRPVAPPVNLVLQVLDFAACAALLFVLARFLWLGVLGIRSRRHSGEWLLLAPSAALACLFAAPGIVAEPYDFMRQNSALLMWTFLALFPERPRAALLLLAVAAAPLAAYRAAPLLRALSG